MRRRFRNEGSGLAGLMIAALLLKPDAQPVHSSARSGEKELIQHLRSTRRIRRSRHARDSGHHISQFVDAISIRERPAEIEDRAVPGHWEGDLLVGT